jgi:zinc transporter, ZIP family
MTDWFLDLTPPAQALLAGTFTWLVTAAGASLVFFAKSVSRIFLNVMLGFAAGVMIAASVWSLLLPAIDLSEGSSLPAWFPAAVGFLLGGAFLRLSDYFVPHLHLGLPREDAEGVETNWRRSTLLIMAITLHNIPEGLAIGVAFGAAAQAGGDSVATVGAAVALAIGIGLQNFPEGIAVAMPLRGDGMSRFRSFFYG